MAKKKTAAQAAQEAQAAADVAQQTADDVTSQTGNVRLLDPYVTVAGPDPAHIQAATPAQQDSQVVIKVPLPDDTSLSLGNVGLPATQTGIFGKTKSHIRLHTTDPKTTISMGIVPSGAVAPTASGVAVPAGGLNLWTDGEKNEYIALDVHQVYAAKHTHHVTDESEYLHNNGRTTTVNAKLNTDNYNDGHTLNVKKNQIIAIEDNRTETVKAAYDLKVGGEAYTLLIESGTKTESMTADYNLTIKGSKNEDVTGTFLGKFFADWVKLTYGMSNELFIGEKGELHLGLKMEGILGGKVILFTENTLLGGAEKKLALDEKVVALKRSAMTAIDDKLTARRARIAAMAQQQAALAQQQAAASVQQSGANVQTAPAHVIT